MCHHIMYLLILYVIYKFVLKYFIVFCPTSHKTSWKEWMSHPHVKHCLQKCYTHICAPSRTTVYRWFREFEMGRTPKAEYVKNSSPLMLQLSTVSYARLWWNDVLLQWMETWVGRVAAGKPTKAAKRLTLDLEGRWQYSLRLTAERKKIHRSVSRLDKNQEKRTSL